MGKSGKFIIYAAYSLIAVLFFLFILFPSEKLKSYVDNRITALDPAINFDTKKIELAFPLGIKLTTASFAYAGIPAVSVDRIKIKPSLFSVFSDTKKLIIAGNVGPGIFKGAVELTIDEQRAQTKLTMNLINIPIDRIEIVNQWPQYSPSGEINGYVDYDSRRGGAGSVNANLEITTAAVAIAPPLMGIETVEFSNIQSELTITPQIMQIKRFEANGLQVDGKVSGSIRFRKPIEQSRIVLSGNIKPQPAFVAEHKNDLIGGLLASQTVQKRGMLFRVSGTLENPKFIPR